MRSGYSIPCCLSSSITVSVMIFSFIFPFPLLPLCSYLYFQLYYCYFYLDVRSLSQYAKIIGLDSLICFDEGCLSLLEPFLHSPPKVKSLDIHFLFLSCITIFVALLSNISMIPAFNEHSRTSFWVNLWSDLDERNTTEPEENLEPYQ